MSRFSDLYLFSYNSLQSFGWAIAFFRVLSNFLSANSVYESAGDLICFLQSLAFLEVIHGAIGIVPSGVLLPLMQWGGRTHFLLAIVCRISKVQESPAVLITFLAWSLMEIIRYPYYSLSGVGNCPYIITYLRCTVFIVIYPIGVAGEMWLMYHALPFIEAENLYANFFHSAPFSYSTFVKVVLLCYPFLWLRLYRYLFKQRHSKLHSRHDKKKKKS